MAVLQWRVRKVLCFISIHGRSDDSRRPSGASFLEQTGCYGLERYELDDGSCDGIVADEESLDSKTLFSCSTGFCSMLELGGKSDMYGIIS